MKGKPGVKLGQCVHCEQPELAGEEARAEELLCLCHEVTEQEVRAAVSRGAASVLEVTRTCQAGGGCGACHVRIERVLRGLPAKCASGRFDLCGDCGWIGALCDCPGDAEIAAAEEAAA